MMKTTLHSYLENMAKLNENQYLVHSDRFQPHRESYRTTRKLL